MPHVSSGPSVAKILLRTRKSGWPICSASTASGRASASLRNSLAVMRISSGVTRQAALDVPRLDVHPHPARDAGRLGLLDRHRELEATGLGIGLDLGIPRRRDGRHTLEAVAHRPLALRAVGRRRLEVDAVAVEVSALEVI